MGPISKIKPAANSSYTTLLVAATVIVILTTLYIMYKCNDYYGVVFRILEAPRF